MFTRILSDCGIKGSVRDRDAGSGRDDHAQIIPAIAVPKLDPKRGYEIDVMQVGIGEFPQCSVDPKVQVIPDGAGDAQFLPQSFQEPESMELPILFVLILIENEKRTFVGGSQVASVEAVLQGNELLIFRA